MKSKWLKGLLCAVIISSMCLGIIEVYKAQNSTGSTLEVLEPKRFRTYVADKTYDDVILLRNYSNEPLELEVRTAGFVVKNSQGAVGLYEPDKSDNLELANWIELSTASFTLPVTGSTPYEYKFKVKVPAGINTLARYGAVVFKTKNATEAAAGSNIGQKQEIPALILTTVGSGFNFDVEITEFKTDSKLYWNAAPEILVKSKIKNNGNVHVIPSGPMTIVNSGYLESALFNSGSAAVLPGSVEREIEDKMQIEKSFIPKFGRFTVEAQVTFGGNVPFEKVTYTFWIIPIKFFAAVAIGILSVIFILRTIYVAYRKNK